MHPELKVFGNSGQKVTLFASLVDGEVTGYHGTEEQAKSRGKYAMTINFSKEYMPDWATAMRIQ